MAASNMASRVSRAAVLVRLATVGPRDSLRKCKEQQLTQYTTLICTYIHECMLIWIRMAYKIVDRFCPSGCALHSPARNPLVLRNTPIRVLFLFASFAVLSACQEPGTAPEP